MYRYDIIFLMKYVHTKRYLYVHWTYFHSCNNKISDHTYYEPHNWTSLFHHFHEFSMIFHGFWLSYTVCFIWFKHWKIIEFIHLRYIIIIHWFWEFILDYDCIPYVPFMCWKRTGSFGLGDTSGYRPPDN